ncbi:YcaO-like family protein [Cellulomonas gilvus]|uniref:YcaO domain-containing protein n=1 Tax=Cellulomonas gilvus (strain ATCC 13127 / NRRL B-14078) TaxID=593907 RepID=F8A260_CELGA|nr:YcaO-like family protein [Cellulomonas gilvus]AEI10580.1 protein of unknown function DUF181 [Cellulomonas gilvus ATCC 13127]
MDVIVTEHVPDAVDAALRTGRARLRVRAGELSISAHGSHVLVGPLLPADTAGDASADDPTGCLECALAWRADVAPHQVGGPPTDVGLDWSATVEALVASVVADGPAAWQRRVLALDRATGTLTPHRFLVHPACIVCSAAWEPPAPLDVTTPQPARPATLRTRSFDRSALRTWLSDTQFGPVTRVRPRGDQVLVEVESVVPGRARREIGRARGTTYAAAEVGAYLEVLERMLGGYRRPSVPVVVASWQEVAHQAVDPRTLGGHVPELFTRSAQVEPFAPRTTTSWVWGRSTREDRPVLVPEHVAFCQERGVGARFLHETTAACAIGATREEAVLHALLRTVERDAFLLAWYSRARLVEIAPQAGSALDHGRRLLARHGARLRVLDLTTDFGVPVALAVATSDDEQAVRSGRVPAVTYACSAAADPANAVRGAVRRCTTTVLAHSRGVGEHERSGRPRLHDDFDRVCSDQDRTELHASWEARRLGAFLEHPAAVVAETEHAALPGLPGRDVAHALGVLLERTHGLGMDAIVIDQSQPELVEAVGLHVVKVLVPGTVPRTEGHALRRTVGLPRLAAGATILRGARTWTDDPRPNPVPHP